VGVALLCLVGIRPPQVQVIAMFPRYFFCAHLSKQATRVGLKNGTTKKSITNFSVLNVKNILKIN